MTTARRGHVHVAVSSHATTRARGPRGPERRVGWAKTADSSSFLVFISTVFQPLPVRSHINVRLNLKAGGSYGSVFVKGADECHPLLISPSASACAPIA
eukprot:5914423-Prymnesium_polylepis.1